MYCGGCDVSRKSRPPRLKKYVDSEGQVQTIEVYRFYCHNPACPHQTFTNLPPHLLPYCQWSLEWRVAALQSYEWMHSVYRCTGLILKVDKMTAYRWVSDFGYELLPVAALFGLVRSSGVIGVDEKYVLVPKNNKPESKMKRWMYVYFAVDCYTYDLLHIEIYPYDNHLSATAFLLALRAKGYYHPHMIVTDLRHDYGPTIAQVSLAAGYAHTSRLFAVGRLIGLCAYQALLFAAWAWLCRWLERRWHLSWIVSAPLCLAVLENAIRGNCGPATNDLL